MDVRTYRQQQKQTQTEAAKAIGISQVWLSHIECGRRFPSAAVARRIVEWSNGAVGFEDVFKPRTEAA